MKPLISVIIPIYNVEEFLPRCVNSVIKQTFETLEIILVDDGSPDHCPEICDEFARQDSRIKVIHKKNGGLSDARNAGMEIASGEYISFIDSDDYISTDFIETLYNTTVAEKSDIAECSVVKFYENDQFDEHTDDLTVSNFHTVDGLSSLIAENPFHQHVWNKLYKANLITDVPFAVGKLNEDEFWTYQIFARAEKVTKINKTLYFYFQRHNSIMGTGYSLRRLDALEGKYNRQIFIEKKYPSLSRKAKIDLFGSCMFACQCALKYMNGAEKRTAKKQIRGYLKKCKLTFSDIKTIDRGTRKWYQLAKLNFYVCCKLRAMAGIGF